MIPYNQAISSPQYSTEMPHKSFCKERDTEEVAGFLLALKHRSVTPEPPSDDSSSLRLSRAEFQAFRSPVEPQAFVDKTPAALLNEDMPNVESLIGDSKLVLAKDRDLVPDSLFVAMAQMRPCRLTQADRVGCYKAREIGFVGMCCLHCGGQPGFGRFYPNSVRSLAQTTTSQTILKHVGGKCRFCPPHIRNAVNELQSQQAAREGLSSGRPRYGSRKIFFQRVWARLHGGPMSEEDEGSNQTHSDLESEGRYSSPFTSDDEDSQAFNRKRSSGMLPTQKNLKSSLTASSENSTKRPRVLSN